MKQVAIYAVDEDNMNDVSQCLLVKWVSVLHRAILTIRVLVSHVAERNDRSETVRNQANFRIWPC